MTTTWSPLFAPTYTPLEMLEKGVFEGQYINNISGIPAAWKKLPTVLSKDSEPDEKLNYFKVKSRQPLSVWIENKWIKTDKNGWFEWYIHYYQDRRLGEEDDWQIGRWRSFVARHQGQIVSKCDLKDNDCNTRQRQGLLQWGWDSSDKFTPDQLESNLNKMLKSKGMKISKEHYFQLQENNVLSSWK